MSAILSEKTSLSTLDDEEDALLNEAISCSNNTSLEQHHAELLKKFTPRSKKLWCDMTSDSSSTMSDLSLSNGKIDLSTSNENSNVFEPNVKINLSTSNDNSIVFEPNLKIDLSTSNENSNLSVANDKECIKVKIENIKEEPKDLNKNEDHDFNNGVLNIKSDSFEELNIENNLVNNQINKTIEDGEIVDNVTPIKSTKIKREFVFEPNVKNCKRAYEGEDTNCDTIAPKNRRKSTSSSSTMSSNKKPIEYETDPLILARRQKDIDYGKNTIGYDNYVNEIPRFERRKEHPRTPPMHIKSSRRGWDGMIKVWRKQLHFWDPQDESE